MISRAVTVPIEVAHRGVDGVLHGHSLTVEAWTQAEVDLDVFAVRVKSALAYVECGPLEETIGARTFEDLGLAVLDVVEADRVVIRLPTRGHVVEVSR